MNIKNSRNSGVQLLAGILLLSSNQVYAANIYYPSIDVGTSIAAGVFNNQNAIYQTDSTSSFTDLVSSGLLQKLSETDQNGFTAVQNVQAFASANFGELKTFASTDGNAFGGAISGASFSDGLTINANGLEGQSGTLFINLKSTHGTSVSTAELGSHQLSRYSLDFQSISMNQSVINYNTGFQFTIEANADCYITCSTLDTNSLNIPGGPIYSLAVPFIYGQRLGFMLNAYSDAGVAFGGSAVSDSSHSTYWGGITQILDQNSNIVSGFTVVSESGTNYLQDFSVASVPEPETYAMLLAGLVIIGFVSRRKYT